MEGFLIRLPNCAWDNDIDCTTVKKRTRRSQRVCKPQARLLYYILGEGFLEGYASPDDMEPVESFQLTSFEVEVDPVFSMLMFKVTTREIKPAGRPALQARAACDSSDEEDDDDSLRRQLRTEAGDGSIILLFAGDKSLVELWGSKLLNWKRYVFAGPPPGVEESDPAKAKSGLIAAFHEKNNHGMFAIICELKDCTTPVASETPAVASGVADTATTVQSQPLVLQVPTPLPPPGPDKISDGSKPASTEIKPLWMLLNRSSSRRISAIPPKK